MTRTSKHRPIYGYRIVNNYMKWSFVGKGTRVVKDDEQNYLQDLTNRMIASLDRRLAAPEAQTSEEVAQVILNLAKMHLEVGWFNCSNKLNTLSLTAPFAS